MTTEITMPDRDAEGYLLDPADWNQRRPKRWARKWIFPLTTIIGM